MRGACLVGVLFLVAHSPACTIMLIAKNGKVLAGANEDDDNVAELANHYVRFSPPKPGALGYVSFGYARNPLSDESAMNEAGLFYDFAVTDEQLVTRLGLPKSNFATINSMLTKCKTVDEALAFLERFDLVNLRTVQMLIGDATGASAIIERATTTRRTARNEFQIATNVQCSSLVSGKSICPRLLSCTTQLSELRQPTTPKIADVLRSVAADGTSGSKTWYSVVCDLKTRKVDLYRKGNFRKSFRFDLQQELKRGARTVDMDEFIANKISTKATKLTENSSTSTARRVSLRRV